MPTHPHHSYPANSGPHAGLSEVEKRQRLDAMVRIWQRETEQRARRTDSCSFVQAAGLDDYRYSVWLRLPEWERAAVVGQVLTLSRPADGGPQDPAIFTLWRRDPLLHTLADWKRILPAENAFTISVRLTPGGLGEGARWAIVMPTELIPRYRPGWPTQRAWVAWTGTFDWLALAVPCIHAMLQALAQG